MTTLALAATFCFGRWSPYERLFLIDVLPISEKVIKASAKSMKYNCEGIRFLIRF